MKYIEEFKVTLERVAIMPGDVLRGSVSFILRQPIKAKSLAIHFEGEGLAVDTQVKNKNRTCQFMYLDDKIAMFNKLQPEVMEAFQTPGKHTFFFRHRLPRNLPGSFSYSETDHDASISYSVYAMLKKPKRFGCKQTTTRVGVKILKTPSDDYDVPSQRQLDCLYKYVSLDELDICDKRESLSARHPARDRTGSAYKLKKLSSWSSDSVLSSTYDSRSDAMSLDLMGNSRSRYTAHSSESIDCADHSRHTSSSSKSGDCFHSRHASQSSESDAFDRSRHTSHSSASIDFVGSRHTSVDDSGLDDDDVQEHIMKVLQTSDTGKETGDGTSSVWDMNTTPSGKGNNVLIKTVIII